MSSIFLTIYDVVVLSPVIGVVAEYSTISPLKKPWFLKLIVSKEVEIPDGFTLNLRCVSPEPEFITLTAVKVVLFSVLNLWIPLAEVSVAKPMVLIPANPNNASLW